ncbi:cyclase family protein [Phytohabitans kaempferiae]|uniref:Cyclase family protein n=1 Tax=Phytohabitans kaempferiae TaxID=1620943 RepID=A0ABV6MAQ1_9ACTN
MSRTTINLTRPITTESPAGSHYPWEAPYRTEDIATLTYNGANLFHITMGSGAATRMIGPGLSDPDGATVDKLRPEQLVNRDAVVVAIPAGETPGREIGADAIRAALDAADLRAGDAVVLATGWGDDPARFTDDDYYLDSPYLTVEAATTLAELLTRNGTDLVLTDCVYLDRPAHARDEWTTLKPWLRPVFPSDAATTYLAHYRPDSVRDDWAATVALTSSVWTVAGLVGCGALAGRRIRLTLAPLNVQGVGEVPCTVIAQPT